MALVHGPVVNPKHGGVFICMRLSAARLETICRTITTSLGRCLTIAARQGREAKSSLRSRS